MPERQVILAEAGLPGSMPSEAMPADRTQRRAAGGGSPKPDEALGGADLRAGSACDRWRHTGNVEEPGIDPSQPPTPWRQLVVPLSVCGAGIFVGVFLKGAGNTSIIESTLSFVGYIAFIAILGLIAYAITGHT